jgi:general secretion pathway protein G
MITIRTKVRIVIVGLFSALIVATLAAMFSINQHEVRRAKQAVLEEDHRVIQTAIHAYTVDKGHPPQSLNDLVDAGYLKAIPQDPPTLLMQ